MLTSVVRFHFEFPRAAPHLQTLFFHTLANSLSRNPFVLILIQTARGVVWMSLAKNFLVLLALSHSCQRPLTHPLSFHSLLHSFAKHPGVPQSTFRAFFLRSSSLPPYFLAFLPLSRP